MKVALVNTNRVQPPIAPIGLDYVAEALTAHGHQVSILDLCWEADPELAIQSFFKSEEYGLVGVTIRNTDDCSFTERKSFVPQIANAINSIRQNTGAPIVLGGAGFSVMPEQIMAFSGVDMGLWGEGEFTLPALATALENNADWTTLPNLIHRGTDRFYRNPPAFPSLKRLPAMSRDFIDNQRYFLHGGQVGFETKRGCPRQCIYCADPIARGHRVRTRPPEAVANEIERLLTKGIDHLHTCDSEFNLLESHAIAVCQELVRRGLGERIRWYAYCSPVPFSEELARWMHDAGCVGINFGVDSGDAEMLKRLKRDHTPEDILNIARLCQKYNIRTMFDLLLGAPGESTTSIANTIELVKKAAPDAVGVSVGVRVYPGTEMAFITQRERQGFFGSNQITDPLFYLEPDVADEIFDHLQALIGDDERFFFFDPTKPEANYNYNNNSFLVDAIRQGYRGAYWDILRQLR